MDINSVGGVGEVLDLKSPIKPAGLFSSETDRVSAVFI